MCYDTILEAIDKVPMHPITKLPKGHHSSGHYLFVEKQKFLLDKSYHFNMLFKKKHIYCRSFLRWLIRNTTPSRFAIDSKRRCYFMTNEMQNLDLNKVVYSILFRSSYEIFEPFLLEILGRSLIDEKRLTRPLPIWLKCKVEKKLLIYKTDRVLEQNPLKNFMKKLTTFEPDSE
jgi:hypothetical protein